MMKAIVVVDREWNIGFQGKLLVHLPGDLQYFKEKTKGKTVVMGRKTYESLPGQKPLPGRTNIVLTRDPKGFQARYGRWDNLFAVSSLPDHAEDDIFVIGGGEVYSRFLPDCDEVFVTKLNKLFTADTRFANLDQDPEWMLVWESEPQAENGVEYAFTRYQRHCVRS